MDSPKVMLVLVVLVASVMHTKAIDCDIVGSTMFSCSGFLKESSPTPPASSSCCNSAQNLLRLGDVRSLCECLSPFTQGFLRSKAQMISSQCNLPAFSPLVSCIAPSSNAVPDSFLPPLAPLPPIFNFQPIFPLPPWVPIPPVFPDPPTPNSPTP